MDLPSHFLADLPDASGLSPSLVRDACGALKVNRERWLLPRTTSQIIHALAGVAAEWLDPGSAYRQRALWEGPRHTGFSRQTLEQGLDAFFREITVENLNHLIVQEFGSLERLDQFCSSDPEAEEERASFVHGPELILHIAGGRLPNPVFASMIQGLLVRSAQFIKCPSGASFLPRLFAHCLHECDHKLASCVELAEWKGGNDLLEGPVLEAADCVTATGSDETLRTLRGKIPSHTRFVGYGTRVSFAYVTREVLSGLHPGKFAARAARDTTAWDQLGCLSPHVIYVETGAKVPPERFAALLAEELAALEQSEPRGDLPVRDAAAIASRRAFYQLRSAAACQTKIWASPDSTAWTVIFEEDPQFQLSCLNRFIYVKSAADPAQVMASADAVRKNISTIGLAAPEHRAAEIAKAFALWGATRICPLGQMQSPSILWRHDGRPSLSDLVTWTDWEQSS